MSKKKKLEGKMKISPEDGDGLGRFSRAILTILVMFVILMITFGILAYTDWVKSLAEDRLEKVLGTEVTAKNSRLGLPYVLVLEKVQSKNVKVDEQTWFEADEVRVGLWFRPRWRVTIKRALLHAVERKENETRPEIIARLADLDFLDRSEISEFTALIRENVALDVDDSKIEWFDGRGRLMGAANGIFFKLQPVRLPSRKMYYHYLRVYDYRSPLGGGLHDSEKEWLSADAFGDTELPGRKRPAPETKAVKREKISFPGWSPVKDPPPPPPSRIPLIKRDRRRTK